MQWNAKSNLYFLVYEWEKLFWIEKSLRLLIEIRFVRRTASFGDEQKVVFVSRCGVQLDLCGKIGPGVLLVEHVKRCDLQKQPKSETNYRCSWHNSKTLKILLHKKFYETVTTLSSFKKHLPFLSLFSKAKLSSTIEPWYNIYWPLSSSHNTNITTVTNIISNV